MGGCNKATVGPWSLYISNAYKLLAIACQMLARIGGHCSHYKNPEAWVACMGLGLQLRRLHLNTTWSAV